MFSCTRSNYSQLRPPYRIATFRVKWELLQRPRYWWGLCPLRELLVSRDLQVGVSCCHVSSLGISILFRRRLRLIIKSEIIPCSFSCSLPAHLCSYPVSPNAHALISFNKSQSAALFQLCERPLLSWSWAQHWLQLKTQSSVLLYHQQEKDLIYWTFKLKTFICLKWDKPGEIECSLVYRSGWVTSQCSSTAPCVKEKALWSICQSEI